MFEMTGGKTIFHCNSISTQKTLNHGPVVPHTWHSSEVAHILDSSKGVIAGLGPMSLPWPGVHADWKQWPFKIKTSFNKDTSIRIVCLI